MKGILCPNKKLSAQSQQQIRLIKVWNMLQANNKDTKTMSGYVVLMSLLLILRRFNTKVSRFKLL